MEDLYHRTRLTIEKLNGTFQRFDTVGNEEEFDRLVQGEMENIFTSCDRLEILVHKEPASRRHVAKLKVDQLKYDVRHLKAVQENLRRKREERLMQEKNRNELLHRTFRANEDTTIDMDRMLNFHSSAQNANRGVDDLIAHGGSVLENLRHQRSTLKSARKRMLDVVNNLGLSNTVMRLIEKRGTEDRFVLFGGMALTCICMLLIVVYLY
ncbi:Golgi SNAP receptor complex member 2 [Galendromus occidentalis]|uniref:Golgi SNAP receptor complex member 2 n=1 Tax=Galendromus occidentalis TaxID=34638 RepID=A0AAJ6QMJ9_9ACAR|nr:Golgi SNAP receptor complex member 2 [Galendromus occidentalis]